MAGKAWSQEEIDFLRELGPVENCEDIAKELERTTRSVQHKFNQLGLKKKTYTVGDIVKGWKIIELYDIKTSNQRRTMAKIHSIVNGEERHVRLTVLNQGRISSRHIEKDIAIK